MNTIQFLTRVGQTCTPIRQEFILLSDVLGVSALVDALNHPACGDSTESAVLGPFLQKTRSMLVDAVVELDEQTELQWSRFSSTSTPDP